MRKATALTICTLLAACGGSAPASFQDQARNAMPRSEGVKMGSPQGAGAVRENGSGSGGDAMPLQDSTVGDASGFFSLTVGLSAIVNGGTAATLAVLKAVTDNPASNCTDTSCTWGPGSSALDANNYKLVVSKDSKGNFTYALSGEAKTKPGSGYVTFLSGIAIPGSAPHTGSGEIVIDNDARAKLDGGNGDIGKLTIDYSNTGPLTVSASAVGVNDNANPGQKLNVGYQFANSADGGGDLDVAFKNLTTLATWSIHSRWKPTGAGRGDARIVVGAFSATASECWAAGAGAFKVSFFTSTDPNQPTSGKETDCAYDKASYGSVAAPNQ